MRKFWLIIIFSVCSTLSAGTIRIFNDSAYKLRVVIRSSDGTYVGEMVMLPQHFNTWTGEYNDFDSVGGDPEGFVKPSPGQPPYTVQWFCLDGGLYSISTNVATGGTVTAQQGDGARQCKPQKKKKEATAKSPDEEVLHEQNEAPSISEEQ
jgi:hypothetical protein